MANTSIKEATIYVPDVWSAQWFRRWVIEQLSKADVRNAIGVGVEITTEGNSVATLTTNAETAGSIDAHNADPNANAAAFAQHNSDINAHALSYRVADLPPGVKAGARAMVSDATSVTFLSPATGGGTSRVPVFFNGSGWIVG
jgi:hypothetical protein